MYKDLESLLKSDAYGQDLENELEKSYPGFIKQIQMRIRDMNESDHGIVMAGTKYWQSIYCKLNEIILNTGLLNAMT